MSRPGNNKWIDFLALPVVMVAVFDHQAEGSAGGSATHQAAHYHGCISFHLHTRTRAAAGLPAGEIHVNGIQVKFQSGRKAVNDRCERRPVALAGGEET